jgi:isoleucyl-tRNA synthetase
LGFILLNLTKILAPFLPFLTEYIYKNLKPQTSNLKSVHLEDWPKANKRLIDKKLNEKMDLVRKIVSLGLKARAKAKIKVRQPLALLEIQNSNLKNQLQKEDLLNLIKEELNVKEVKIVEKLSQGKDWLQEAENEIKIALNIKITPELKEEGILRQIIRHLQQMRKEAGFKPKDKISIQFRGDKEIEKLLLKNKEFILKETKAKELKIEEKEKQLFKIKREFKINQKEIWLAIRKL